VASLESCQLEPEVITTYLIRTGASAAWSYQDLPKVSSMPLAAEDHAFFAQWVNIFRLIAATITALRSDDRIKDTSTLTMQLARFSHDGAHVSRSPARFSSPCYGATAQERGNLRDVREPNLSASAAVFRSMAWGGLTAYFNKEV
jgi:hypothetical protein